MTGYLYPDDKSVHVGQTGQITFMTSHNDKKKKL